MRLACDLELKILDNMLVETPLKKKSFRWVAVPYHFWGNRKKGEMRVWMQEMQGPQREHHQKEKRGV